MQDIFQEGDKVFDIRFGWGVVVGINKAVSFPVNVRFPEKEHFYEGIGGLLSHTEYTLQGFSQQRHREVTESTLQAPKFRDDHVPSTETKGETLIEFKEGEWFSPKEYRSGLCCVFYEGGDEYCSGMWNGTWANNLWTFDKSKEWRPATRSEIIQALRAAFQAGERVEYNVEGLWLPITKLEGIKDDEFEYRLAPPVKQEQYRPFTWEDRGEIMAIDWVKYKDIPGIITRILEITNHPGIVIARVNSMGNRSMTLEEAFRKLETIDGKPFGKKI